MAVQHTTIFLEKPKRSTFNDLEGRRFGKYLVLGLVGRKPTKWLCRCDCGNERSVKPQSLLEGQAQSCGCRRLEWIVGVGKKNATHGLSKTPESEAFWGAKKRCENPKAKGFERYGGRGIKFLIPGIDAMVDDIGLRPSTKHSIDRDDNNGHYEIGNIKWSTKEEQARNRRSNRIITINGETMLLIDWTKETGIKGTTFRERVKRGWCDQCAITVPSGGSRCTHIGVTT